jgi:uncharacterized protein (DUF2267 family)
MSATGLDVFDTTLQKTHSWLNEVMRLMDWQDKHKAYQAVRVTLHALRDRLSVGEVAQLGAQLPMLIRGFYYEGWRPDGAVLTTRHKEEFLAPIAEHFRSDPEVDAERIARRVRGPGGADREGRDRRHRARPAQTAPGAVAANGATIVSPATPFPPPAS